MEQAFKGYRLRTFQVQFIAEPKEHPPGSPCRFSDDVERAARAIYRTQTQTKSIFSCWP